MSQRDILTKARQAVMGRINSIANSKEGLYPANESSVCAGDEASRSHLFWVTSGWLRVFAK